MFSTKPRIALIQPDSPFLTEPLSFPGLGLLYISSFLKSQGYDPEVYDLTGRVQLPSNMVNYDIFGFSCQVVHFLFAAQALKQLKRNNPKAIFVIGGPLATWMPRQCLNAGFDFVVRGEGELPMLHLVQNLAHFRNKLKEGEDFQRELLPEEDLDVNSMPFPDWEAIDIHRYRYRLEGRRCMSLVTSRGNCPWGAAGHCRFCSKTNLGRNIRLRFRTTENVLNEAKVLRDRYGFNALMLYDDEMMVNKKRDIDIFEGLKRLDIKFRCMTRADLVTKEDLRMMKECGCVEVCLGAESGDPYILEKVVYKGTTVEQNTRFVQWCHEVGLKVKAYLIIGLPSESKHSVENTKNWLKATKPDNYDLSTFEPYPGSEFYDHKELYEIDWKTEDLEQAWMKGTPQYETPVVWTPYLSTQEILELRNQIQEEVPRGIGGMTPYWGTEQQPNAQEGIPVCEPNIGEEELQNAIQCLRTSQISGWAGKYIDEFEQKFSAYCGAKHGIATTNCGIATLLALESLGIGKGDEVITSTFTFAAPIFAIIRSGAKPVVVDCEAKTWNMDTDKIEGKITKRTKAILPVHIYGHPVDMNPILELARKYALYVIEDAAEAHGAEYYGRKVGCLGTAGCFSFYINKIITTGEGGMLITNNDSLAEKARLLKNYAPSRERRFLHYYNGFNFRMPNIQAAIGVAQLAKIDKFIAKKRHIASLYSSNLKDVSGVTLPLEMPWAKNVYWVYPLLIEDEFGLSRDQVMQKLTERGIETRTFFVPMNQEPV